MSDDIGDAFRQLRREIARRITPLPMHEITRRAHRRRLAQWASGATAAVVVAAIGVAVWLGSSASNKSDVAPVGPAPSERTSVRPSTPATASEAAVAKSASAASASMAAAASAAASEAASSAPAQPNVTSVALPQDYWFNALATDAAHLLLTGTPASTGQDTACVAAPVDTTALNVGAVVTGDCSDPALIGRTVTAVNSYIPLTNNATISIAHVDAGKVTTGPVVMTYDHSSTSNPVTAYGGGWLWIYDVATTNGPEAIQVSATSGRVVEVVRMPQLYRPIAAANSDGLWLGNSIQGSPADAVIFHVAPGSHAVAKVMPGSHEIVDWLVAGDGHLWAGTRHSGDLDETLWKLDGSTAKVAVHVAEPGLLTRTVVGDEADGLWTAVPYPAFGATPSLTDNHQLNVVRLDPDTGKQTVEAILPALPQLTAEQGLVDGSMAIFGGNFFVLEPPFRQGGWQGYSELARITPLPTTAG